MMTNNAQTLYLNKPVCGIFKIMHSGVLNYKIRNKQITCFTWLLYIPCSVGGKPEAPHHVLFLSTILIKFG
jgi:hypothetical protein